MLKTRVIPVLLYKDNQLVRSENFSSHSYIGDALHEVIRLSQWGVDELIYLDISSSYSDCFARSDSKHKLTSEPSDLVSILPAVSKHCFIPLTVGGNIRNVDDIQRRLMAGADKVSINSAAFKNPDFITRASALFGSQCIVVAVDAIVTDCGFEVVIDKGKTKTGTMLADWCNEIESRGAGEILIQSIDRDGTGIGYDVNMIERAMQSTSLPVIALGGAGKYSDFSEAVNQTDVSAVAAANIFHFKEMADRHIKREMLNSGILVRA